MCLKDKYLVLLRAGENYFVDDVYGGYEEAFNRARLLRRESGLPVIVARIVEAYG